VRLGAPATEQWVLNAENPDFHDGLARALNGNFSGAIEDFQFFIEYLERSHFNYNTLIDQRQRWVKALGNGGNPSRQTCSSSCAVNRASASWEEGAGAVTSSLKDRSALRLLLFAASSYLVVSMSALSVARIASS
jgi:hypothetical protein